VHENIRESGLPLVKKIDALKRERQLVSLAAASQSMSRTFKRNFGVFSGSSKSVRDEVDEALAKDMSGSDLRNMNGADGRANERDSPRSRDDKQLDCKL
jgi:hypothetical protein